jgi:hypothetical protein
VALYVVASVRGVVVKLPGEVTLNPDTGQISTTFDNNPQIPFSSLRLQFDGGPRAALVAPAACGTYMTHAVLTGWSGKTVSSDSPFTLTENSAGQGCPSTFSPAFSAGTVNPQAGAFSPLVLSFSRNDSEQEIKGLTDTFPPGVSAVLKGVPLCSESDAAAGSCPRASRIGSVTVGSGAGPDPFFLKGGIYLTGPYNGGPFGEAVEVPVLAGPFDLGNVSVRGSIRIDPRTAQPTVVSDPFPTFVNRTGIPADIRRADVKLDREKFTFNPTNCEPLSVNGTLTSTRGTSVPVSSRFQAANRNLCTANMNMPTTIVSQNGAVVKQTTKIAVNGCAKKTHKAGRQAAQTQIDLS